LSSVEQTFLPVLFLALPCNTASRGPGRVNRPRLSPSKENRIRARGRAARTRIRTASGGLARKDPQRQRRTSKILRQRRDLRSSPQVACGEAYSALRGWRPIPAAPLFPLFRNSGGSPGPRNVKPDRRPSFHHRQRNRPLPNRMSIGKLGRAVKSNPATTLWIMPVERVRGWAGEAS